MAGFFYLASQWMRKWFWGILTSAKLLINFHFRCSIVQYSKLSQLAFSELQIQIPYQQKLLHLF